MTRDPPHPQNEALKTPFADGCDMRADAGTSKAKIRASRLGSTDEERKTVRDWSFVMMVAYGMITVTLWSIAAFCITTDSWQRSFAKGQNLESAVRARTSGLISPASR